MPRIVCGISKDRPERKLAALYWAWFDAGGTRQAWKQHLCASCAQDVLASLLEHADDPSGDVSMCPHCGGNSADDLDPIYLSLYVPGEERRDYELTTCGLCAAQVRIVAIDGATRLPNRQDDSKARADATVHSAWGWFRNGSA